MNRIVFSVIVSFANLNYLSESKVADNKTLLIAGETTSMITICARDTVTDGDKEDMRDLYCGWVDICPPILSRFRQLGDTVALLINSDNEQDMNFDLKVIDWLSSCSTPVTVIAVAIGSTRFDTGTIPADHTGLIIGLNKNNVFEQYIQRLEKYDHKLHLNCSNWPLTTSKGACNEAKNDNRKKIRNSALQLRNRDRGLVENKTLRVGVLPYKGPFVQKIFDNNTNTTTFQGITLELMSYFAATLKFRYTIHEPPEYAFGISDERGHFTGLVGMLQRKEIDLIAAALSISEERSFAVDFASSTFYYSTISIMITQPEAEKKLTYSLKPFRAAVWTSLMVTLFIASLYLYALFRYNGFWTLSRFQDYRVCLSYLFCAMINQDYDVDPIFCHTSTFLAFWWIYCIVVSGSYTGSLISILSTQKRTIPFTNLTELVMLVQDDRFKICMENTTSFFDAMQKHSSKINDYKVIVDWLAANPYYARSNIDDCVQIMLDTGSVAIVADRMALETLQLEHCRDTLVILDYTFYPNYYSLAFQKGSPLVDMFSGMTTLAVETGLFEGWKQKYSGTSEFCEIYEPGKIYETDDSPMSLEEMGGMFVTLCVGVLISLIVLLAEHLLIKMHSTRRVDIPSATHS